MKRENKIKSTVNNLDMMQTCQNDLDFSLCAALSVCHIVITSDE